MASTKSLCELEIFHLLQVYRLGSMDHYLFHTLAMVLCVAHICMGTLYVPLQTQSVFAEVDSPSVK